MNEKLESIRKRIATLRTWLEESPPGVTAISVNGSGGSMSQGIDRKSVIEELRSLEREEIRILRGGDYTRTCDLSGAW